MKVPKIKETSKFQQALLSWGAENVRSFPWREVSEDSYKVVSAELLLKRTTASAAARISPKFIDEYPSLEKLSYASVEELIKNLRPLGLSSQRAHLIKKGNFFRHDG